MAGGSFGGNRGGKKRRVLEMQLTTLVDIFVIIVIFMVSGMVIGASDLSVPTEMKPPISFGKEQLESAPIVVISPKDVKVSSLDAANVDMPAVPLPEFKAGRDVTTPAVAALKTTLTTYVQALPPERKVSGTTLNIVADRETPYSDIFDVVRVFREAGFETMLFVAAGDRIPDDLQLALSRAPVSLPTPAGPPAAGQPANRGTGK